MLVRVWSKYFTLLAFAISSSAFAVDWQADNHQIFSSDTTDIIHLQPNNVQASVDIPYNIALDLSIAPNFSSTLLTQSNDDFSLSYAPNASEIDNLTWTTANYVRHFGDFNGDGHQDVLLQPQTVNAAGLIVLGFAVGGTPAIWDVLTPANQGLDISTQSVSFSIEDVDQDGLSDIRLQFTGALPDAIIYSKFDTQLTSALPYLSCDVNDLIDTDCDGTADRYDNELYDPNTSTNPIANIIDSPVGTIAGSFAVTSNGKASYSIPLNLVPGNASPGLSLSYNQQSGNGVLGMGWHINGLSEIGRCPTTLVQDGYINGVNFNSSDQYCINGQRLVKIATNEYRTENETFTKIVASGAAGNGPASFTVWKADGQIETYGGAANSRRITQGGGHVLTWALSRTEDRQGNYASFNYHNSNSAGEFWISRIDYNGNALAGQATNRKVSFAYETRSDVTPSLANSTLVSYSQRLKNIKTYLDESLVRTYTLAYTSGTSQRSLIANIEECLANQICMPKTQFAWDTGLAGESNLSQTESASDNAFPAASFTNQQYHLGDVNADGKADVVWTYRDNNTLGRVLYLANANGSGFTKQSAATDTGYYPSVVSEESQRFLMGDVNGDGKADLVWVARHVDTVIRTIYLANSAGTGFVSQGYEIDINSEYSDFLNGSYQLADVNGDQLQDLVWSYHFNNKLGINVYSAKLSGNNLYFGKVSQLTDTDFSPDFYNNQQFASGDVNGDGKTDLVWSFTLQDFIYRTLYLANANGGGFTKISLGKDSFSATSSEHQVQLSDINADGKADLIWTYKDDNRLTRVVYQASRLGTSFNKKTSVADTSFSLVNHTHGQTRLADLNGDDRLDLIYSYVDNTTFGWVSYLANMAGTGFTKHQSGSHSTDAGTSNHAYRFADITGDGKSDMVWTYNTSTGDLKRYTFTQQQSYPDHITRVTNGLGEQINVHYTYLAGSSIYTPGAAVSYPLRRDSGLSYVVSSHQRSNGIGGFNSWNYQYKGAKTHLTGRGFLGFAQRIVTDNQRNFITTENYHQSYPFIGTVSSSQVKHGAIVIEQTQKDWRQVALHGGKNTYRYLNRQASIKRNLTNGAEVYASVLHNTYNNTYGTLTKTVTHTGRGYSSYALSNIDQTVTTDYDYDNSAADWRLGFVSNETKTFAVAGEIDRAVSRSFVPVSSRSLLIQSEVNFVGTDVEQARAYSYDNFGNVTSTTITGKDIDNGSITTQVDSVNNYISGLYENISTNSEGHQEQNYYDERYGSLASYKDVNNLYADSIYDGFGHLLYNRATDSAETKNQFSWCAGGCPAEAEHAIYAVTQTLTHAQASGQGAPQQISYFNLNNREVATQTTQDNGEIVWQQSRYDALGRMIQKSQPYIAGDTVYWTDYSYDNLDRALVEQRPDGGKTVNQYLTDATYGRHSIMTATVKVPDMSDKILLTQIYSNSLGQMLKSIDATDTPTHFAYDAQGNLRWVQVDNNSAADIVITTDVTGNRTQLIDPDAGLINYAFDSLGRERRRSYGTGADLQTTLSSYDRLGRLLTRTDNDGTSDRVASWSYDAVNGIGSVASETALNYSKLYSYDSFSRVNRVEQTLLGLPQTNKAFYYAYDAFSRPLNTTYPTGLSVSNNYDDRGYLANISDATTGIIYWQALARDAFGNVVSESFANGVRTSRDYEPTTGRIATINTGKLASANSHQNLSYVHDSAGNLVQRSSTRAENESLDEHFVYDDLHRINSATTTGLATGTRVLNYGYDALGNITSKSDVSDINGYSYGANGGGVHAVSSVSLQGVNTDYHYDFKGNMTQRGDQTLQYTVFNKPLAISGSGNSSFLQYGPNRSRFYQRSVKDGDFANITNTLYYNSAYELTYRGPWIREKTTIGDFLVVTKITNNSSPSVAEDFDYLHRDHLGSVEAISNASGNFTGRYSFDVWGKRQKDDWQATDVAYDDAISERVFESTTRGFTGHEHLDSVGLIHMNGRVYDPIIGRFLSTDDYVQMPENSQSYNRYTYVLNNPLSYTDPSGEFLPLLWGAAILAIKAYDAYTTIEEVHSTVTNDNLSTGEKSGQLLGQLATAFVPGKGLYKKFRSYRKSSQLNVTPKPKPQANNPAVGSKSSQKGTGSDTSTTPQTSNKSSVVADKEVGPGVTNKVNGNSKQSTKAQHGYEIVDTKTNTVCKTGVSGCGLNQNGTSPRANSQANKWNKEPGNEGRYQPRVVKEVPAGTGARQDILKWEQQNAARFRQELDPARHSRP